MAQGDKKKKSNGGGQVASIKKGGGEKAKPVDKAVDEVASARSPHAEDAPVKAGAHGGAAVAAAAAAHGGAHAHAGHAGHGAHKVNRKEYMVIFGVLFALTVLEVAVAQIPGIGKGFLVVALVGLALAKAACVGLYYMHLKHETRILRVGVAIPMAAPAVYAFVLIAEAAWRLTR